MFGRQPMWATFYVPVKLGCIEQVCLCGSMTPAPPNKELLKTAVGAAEYVPYTTHSSTLACVQELKKEGITVLAVETTSRSIPMWQCDMPATASARLWQ